MNSIKNFSELGSELEKNPVLQQEFKDDPVKAIQKFSTAVPNNLVYRMVVGSLGLSILLVIIGTIILASSGKPIEATVNTLFAAIASGAVGALAGLLAPQPNGHG